MRERKLYIYIHTYAYELIEIDLPTKTWYHLDICSLSFMKTVKVNFLWPNGTGLDF